MVTRNLNIFIFVLVFIFKSKTNVRNRQEKKGKHLPGPYLRPGTVRPSWPAQPAGPASHPQPPARRMRGAWPTHAGARPATSCLPPPSRRPWRRHAASPTPSHSPPCFSSPLSPSLARIRAQPTPPLAVAAATASLSPPRRAPGIRLVTFVLIVEPHIARSSASPSIPSSSTSRPPWISVAARRRQRVPLGVPLVSWWLLLI